MASNLKDYRISRGLGISAEPWNIEEIKSRKFPTIQKNEKSNKIIKSAIMENQLMRELELAQINAIVEYMYPREWQEGICIIKEGEIGVCMYVIEEGTVEITKNGICINTMKCGDLFGEFALLYDCSRTATVKVTKDCKLWALKRDCFQTIMIKHRMLRQKEYTEFLRNTSTFSALPDEALSKIVEGLSEVKYRNDEYIVKQGDDGEKFYIISEGQARVTITEDSSHEDKFVRILNKGDFFGEKALLGKEKRTANVIADNSSGDWSSCLVLRRDEFCHLKNLDDIKYKYLDEADRKRSKDEEFNDLKLNDLEIVTTLGKGAFGRVLLVKKIGDNKDRSFALKRMNKKKIMDSRQQAHVMSEKEIMGESDSPFIVKLFKTFKNERYLYILTECFLGGELWTVLRDHKRFNDTTARFYVACVTEALHYLHCRRIIYRDLKPENLLLDNRGYVKLVDLGFAKKLRAGEKTMTFCGTPEYVAPEIITSKGHDMSADYWALGILIYELLAGRPPFSAKDHMIVYKNIMRGFNLVSIPKCIEPSATDLMQSLCRKSPIMRIGYNKGGMRDIQNHRWFAKFDWENLRLCRMKAPILPKVKNYTDTSNFDKFEDDDEAVAVDTKGWDESF